MRDGLFFVYGYIDGMASYRSCRRLYWLACLVLAWREREMRWDGMGCEGRAVLEATHSAMVRKNPWFTAVFFVCLFSRASVGEGQRALAVLRFLFFFLPSVSRLVQCISVHLSASQLFSFLFFVFLFRGWLFSSCPLLGSRSVCRNMYGVHVNNTYVVHISAYIPGACFTVAWCKICALAFSFSFVSRWIR